MPEGDAVFRTARRLHEGLAGHVVTDCQLRWPSLAVADLRGATTLEVVPRGKHILHRFDTGWTLHSHLRMDGSWRVKAPAQVTRADLANHRLRALLGCATATALGWQLGMMDLVATADEATLVGHLGPDVLGADWDPDLVAANLLATPDRHVGAALLDQRNLAGVGTMWDAETLFAEGVHPWATTGELGPVALRAIAERAHLLVTQALGHPFSVATGRPSEPMFVHLRDGHPCRRCGTTIRLDWIGEPPQHRFMFWCPRCQPGPVPAPLPGIRPPRRPGPGATG